MPTTKIQVQYESNVASGAKADEQAMTGLQQAADGFKSGFASSSQTMSEFSKASQKVTYTVSQTTNSLSKATTVASHSRGMFSNLANSLGRIAKLRFLRGIIRGITTAISEGTQNLYQYSTALGSADGANFSANMNSLASTLLYVKNSIGAMIAPLLNNLLPAIQTVAGWFVTAANAVAQFMAALGGQATYTRAKMQATTWKATGAAIGGATAAAKEYKNTILGFDEINALNDPTSGGGGGGGAGGGTPDYGDMFEEVPLDTDGLIGAFNRLAKALGPILEKCATIIAEFVEGSINILDGFATFLDGFFEGSQEKMQQGARAMQDVLASNDTWNWIATMYNQFTYGVDKMVVYFKQTIIRGVLDLVENPTFQTIFEALFHFDPSIFTTSLREVDDALDEEYRRLENQERIWKAYYDGLIDVTQLTPLLQGTANATGQVVMQYDKAHKGYINLTNAGVGNNAPIFQTSDMIIERADKMTEAMKKGRDSVTTLGNTPLNTNRIAPSLDVIKKGAEGVEKQMGGAKDSINKVNNLSPTFNGIRGGLANVVKSSDTTKSSLDKAYSSATTLNSYNPGFNGINNGLSAVSNGLSGVAWWITETANRMTNLNGMQANLSINITTLANSVATGLGYAADQIKSMAASVSSIRGWAKGGFVPAYANGGMIPSYASGGINSANLFLANENHAPELVGRIGSRTAVANQGQMIEAIASGLERSLMSVMGGDNGNVEVNVYMDGTRIARMVDKANRTRNRRFNVMA